MPLDAWFTIAVVIATVAALTSERLPAAGVVLGAVTVLLVAGVIDAGQALSGFSNPAPVIVAAMYVFAGAAEATGALGPVVEGMVGRGAASRGTLPRLLVPTAVASAFLNNTTIVAMVAPRVTGWARRTGGSPARYLMPLSFAAILGGLVTVIGTSTNIVVSGLLVRDGLPEIGFFELARVGLPLAAVGIAGMVLVAPRLLRERRDPGIPSDPREFTVEMVVTDGSPLAGRGVAEAGLRNLEGVFLVELERAGRVIGPVGPDEVLAQGDRLTFAGNVERVLDLQQLPGLTSAEERHFDVTEGDGGRRFYEVVVAPGSELAGRTLKDVGFRGRFGAAVVAVHRAGARVPGKLGSVPLHAGDVLLVLADAGFRRRAHDHRSFLVVSPLHGRIPLRPRKAPLVGIFGLALVVLVGTGVLDLLEGSLLTAAGLVITGVLGPSEARDAVDLDVVVLVAASFGIGEAILASGLAASIADALTGGLAPLGDLGLLAGVLLATIVLTELVTNNAAAVLMFPIATATALQAGLDPRPFAIAVAVGASASFLTPIGYQTNTMVYGMGGYRFGDFARLGTPLTVLTIGVALVVIPWGWPLR